MRNQWNKIIYKVWSHLYDVFFNSGAFLKARRKLVSDIESYKGQKVLFVGVGTGADLELIDHQDYEVTAIDYSKDMLDKARRKFRHSTITFLEMDAQQLQFEDESFDLVVGSLILSVVPDANKALREMIRVTSKNGELLIFDKFAPKHGRLSFGKRIIRPFISALGTDIGVNFEKTIEPYLDTVYIIGDKPLMLNGMYRKINAKKIRPT